MGLPRRPERVKLIAGLLSNQPGILNDAKKELTRKFGKIDFESEPLKFEHTEYYKEEFGDALERIFVSFERPFDLEGIYKTKLKTNLIEKRYLAKNKRLVNIDPGYLNLSKLVLFSTKDFSHRLYLRGGIYAEVTLFYKNKKFNYWPWTYPDYKTEAYLDIFDKMRELYRVQVRGS